MWTCAAKLRAWVGGMLVGRRSRPPPALGCLQLRAQAVGTQLPGEGVEAAAVPPSCPHRRSPPNLCLPPLGPSPLH